MKPIAVLDAPTNLGLRPPAPGREPGVRRLPDSLRAQGVVARLGAEDVGGLAAPAYTGVLDPATGIRQAPDIAAYARSLAAAVGRILDTDRFPLVLGGDCSLLLGPALALRRRGRFAIAYLDGHQDLATASTSPSHAAGGMVAGLLLGVGPDILTRFDNPPPLLAPTDLLQLGYRDPDAEYTDPDVLNLRPMIVKSGLDDLRASGIPAAVGRMTDRAASAGVQSIWIHLDADVLDSEIMPAVDSPEPGGLTPDELVELLTVLLRSRLAVGLDVTILDPDLDPDGEGAVLMVDVLARAFEQR